MIGVACRYGEFLYSGSEVSVMHTGSAMTMVLIACAVIACSTMPRRTAEQRVADADTADRVQAALLADPDIYARHIDVRVDRGVVYLGGYVWEDEDFRTARRDAASVAGANAVVTDMELMRGGLAGTSR
jgi:osmotically-inducible protein OsmY